MTTSIEWTNRTWNPVTGCTKVSPGCAHCYAESVAARFWAKQYDHDVPCAFDDPEASCSALQGGSIRQHYRPRRFTDVRTHGDRLDAPLRWRKPSMVFVNSMSDLFHEDVPDAFIDQVFAVMALAPQHTFQILTKRPERMLAYINGLSRYSKGHRWEYALRSFRVFVNGDVIKSVDLALPNVWLGVSVENQHFADERIPLLIQTPAAVRFISAEPLLGSVDLTHVRTGPLCPNHPDHRVDVLRGGTWTLRTGLTHVSPEFVNHSDMERLDWVIVGGESGPKARLCDVDWIRSIVAQCQSASVPVFVKQLGADPRWANTDLDPLAPARGKCNDPAGWPPELRVREFPEARA